MPLVEDLKNLDCGDVDASVPTLETYSHDASIFQSMPEAVVFPRSAADVTKVVRYADSHQETAITARSAGTDMTGGAIGQSIVLGFTPHMNALVELTRDASVPGQDGFAVVEPGQYFRDFDRATLARDLQYPVFPASRDLCALGGMVANNAGGERSLKYGKTVDWVRSLRAVLADGNEYELGPLDRAALEHKKTEDTFEGRLYRDVANLLDDNKALIESHRPTVSKNSSGYYLWLIDDGSHFNLAKLMCGSQGTLGIITQATVGLVQPPKHRVMVISFFHTLDRLAQAVNDLLVFKPETIESFDDKTLSFTLRFLPDFVKLLGASGVVSLAWQFLPEFFMVLRGGLPKMIVLTEFTGADEAELRRTAAQAVEVLKTRGIKARVAKNDAEAKKYQTIRRQSFQVIRSHTHGARSTPFIDDFIVPPVVMPEFLPKLYTILAPYKLTLTIAGHPGNGNFHIIPLMDLRDEKVRAVIPVLSEKVYALVLEYGGSITAEHNDGLIRGPYVERQFGPQMYALFRQIKHLFDPKGIFNPGKKIDVDWPWALAHIRKD